MFFRKFMSSYIGRQNVTILVDFSICKIFLIDLGFFSHLPKLSLLMIRLSILPYTGKSLFTVLPPNLSQNLDSLDPGFGKAAIAGPPPGHRIIVRHYLPHETSFSKEKARPSLLTISNH